MAAAGGDVRVSHVLGMHLETGTEVEAGEAGGSCDLSCT